MPAEILVLAGVNGAGKSSVAGSFLLRRGASFYNPDVKTRELMRSNPGWSLEEANARAWDLGRQGLEDALAQGQPYNFETTLGARTITALLKKGAQAGAEVHMIYTGLASPEMHLARVRSRVAAGGHDIPEAKIRQRYETSRANLLDLLPHLASLALFDNSEEGDPKTGQAPKPRLLVRMAAGRITALAPLAETPAWAKSIVMLAIKLDRQA